MFSTKEYQYLEVMFNDALQLLSVEENRDMFPLWQVVSKKDEPRFEEAFRKAAKMLNIKNPQSLKEAYEIIPEDFAGRPGRFRNFVAEILVLFDLSDFGFDNFKKLGTKDGLSNPDYSASFNKIPFTIEVCHTIQNENKELLAVDGRALNIVKLKEIFEEMVEQRLPKFERQLSIYPKYKKLAAMVYEGLPATATFMNKFDANEIGQNLLRKANGRIHHFLIMSSQLQPSTFLVPEIEQ